MSYPFFQELFAVLNLNPESANQDMSVDIFNGDLCLLVALLPDSRIAVILHDTDPADPCCACLIWVFIICTHTMGTYMHTHIHTHPPTHTHTHTHMHFSDESSRSSAGNWRSLQYFGCCICDIEPHIVNTPLNILG